MLPQDGHLPVHARLQGARRWEHRVGERERADDDELVERCAHGGLSRTCSKLHVAVMDNLKRANDGLSEHLNDSEGGLGGWHLCLDLRAPRCRRDHALSEGRQRWCNSRLRWYHSQLLQRYHHTHMLQISSCKQPHRQGRDPLRISSLQQARD